MNKRRLNKLASYLDTISSKKFNINRWVGSTPRCGTTACALGYAGLMPAFRRAGLKTVFTEGDREGDVYLRGGSKMNTSAGAAFFDLSFEQAAFLFLPQGYGPKVRTKANGVTPKIVAKRIREMVAVGGIPEKYFAYN